MEKVELKTDNVSVKNAVYLAVASIIDSVIFVLFTYIGVLSFGSILLVLLITVILQALICSGLGFFERSLNRQFSVKIVDHSKEKSEEKQPEKTEEKLESEKAETKAKKENKKAKDDDENINYENI